SHQARTHPHRARARAQTRVGLERAAPEDDPRRSGIPSRGLPRRRGRGWTRRRRAAGQVGLVDGHHGNHPAGALAHAYPRDRPKQGCAGMARGAWGITHAMMLLVDTASREWVAEWAAMD